MRDEKDEEFLDDEDSDGFEEDDEASILLNKDDVPDKAPKGIDARRKLELLREQKELRKLLGDDFDFPLDDEL